jgi:hypothetical protein
METWLRVRILHGGLYESVGDEPIQAGHISEIVHLGASTGREPSPTSPPAMPVTSTVPLLGAPRPVCDGYVPVANKVAAPRGAHHAMPAGLISPWRFGVLFSQPGVTAAVETTRASPPISPRR